MLASELSGMSLSEAAARIARREVSPLDLTRACIERAQHLDAKLNAYITRTFDSALEEARAAGEAIAAGKYRGALHGIPFAIKDLYETAGVVTTAGSPLRRDFVPAEDAETIARLKQAGVVMLGKLNLHEWAMGGTNVNIWYGAAHNPWDLERVTGGSSGGSGAAVAAGLCLGSLGTDTRGSIRIPAALCGITGLKPTYGRVSIRGIIPLSWSLDHSGPMARSAADCAHILTAIAGYDSRDPTCADVPVPSYAAFLDLDAARPLAGVVIGLPRAFFFDSSVVEAEVLAAVEEGARTLAGLGAELRDVEITGPLEFNATSSFTAEAAAYHEASVNARPDQFSEPIRNRLREGQSISAMAYVRERWSQLQLQQSVRALLDQLDLLLTPTCPISPMTIEEAKTALPGTGPTLLGRNTSPFNLMGIPTISVPCGFTSAGLPIGMQLSSGWWQEGPLLRAAHAFQQATDWHKRTPHLDLSPLA